MVLFSYADAAISSHRTRDDAPDPHAFAMHAHEALELYCFLRGKGYFTVEGTKYVLHAGDVLVMREAEAHKLTISSDEPYERVAVHFDPELLRELDPTLRLLRPFYERPLGTRNRFSLGASDGFFSACLDRLTYEPQPDRAAVLAYLVPLLAELSRMAELTHDSGAAGSAAPIIAYINRHLFEKLTLDALAREFFLSKSQLNRAFRRATGTTAAKYIEIKRLLAARSRMRRGEKPGEAARECGFGDYSAFFRAYRAYFGAAPSQDRA